MYVDPGSNRIAIRTPISTNWQGSILKKGSSGQNVKDLQNMLNSAGLPTVNSVIIPIMQLWLFRKKLASQQMVLREVGPIVN